MAHSDGVPAGRDIEILAVRGRLYDDLHFELRGSFSTKRFLYDGRAEASNFRLEIQDKSGNTLNTEPLAMLSEPHDHGSDTINYRLARGCIALMPSSDALLIYKDDLLIRSIPIPSKPKLSLDWRFKRITRGVSHKLRIKHSEAHEGAFLRLLLEKDCGRTIPIGFSAPDGDVTFDLDFQLLPEGKKSRLVVVYSNGLRSTFLRTSQFVLPPPTPGLEILSPPTQARFSAWHWVELQGRVTNVYDAETYSDDLRWDIDGVRVGAGESITVHNMKPGVHVASLSLKGSRANPVTRKFRVVRPKKSRHIPGRGW